MQNMIKIIILIIIITNTCISKENITLAIASNFLYISKLILHNFKEQNKIIAIISSDSTSNLYIKIKNNAPFDIFISADKQHIKFLEKVNLQKNKSYMYAKGKIVLMKNNTLRKQTLKYIKKEKNITLSDKKLSPYGLSSYNFLKNLKIKKENKIFASNINQTFNFTFNKICELGIVALSQIKNKKINAKIYWKIPKYTYPEILQKLIILKNNKTKLNEYLLIHIKKKCSKQLIKKYGYKL